MVELFVYQINFEDSKNLINTFSKYVSTEKINRIHKFYHIEDSVRTLIADIMVRYLARLKYNISNEKIEYIIDDFGKPSIKNYDINFNCSHSGKWVVCAINTVDVGVDVQEVSPIDYDVIYSCFSEHEINEFLKLDEASKKEYFYRVWTLKESYIKAIGKGMQIPLKSFGFKNNASKFYINDYQNHNSTKFKDVYFKEYKFNKNYMLSACSLIDDFCKEMKYLKIEEVKTILCK